MSNQPTYSKKSFFLPVLLFILGLVLGFALQYLLGQNLFIQEEVQKEGPALPIKSDDLANPLVFNWQAAVTGSVAKLTNDSVTVEKDGKSFTAAISPETKVLSLPQGLPVIGSAPSSQEVSLSDINIGDEVALRLSFKDGGAMVSIVTITPQAE